MGRFERTRWVDGQWRNGDETEGDDGRYSLLVVIHDSDIAAITFSPGPPHGDCFFLGYEPADYFKDPRASLPVKRHAVASSFADWVRDATGHKVSKRAIRDLMAGPGRDPQDVFVEETLARLLDAVGLESPAFVS